MAVMNSIGWRFDAAPLSGSRSGGNAAEYAFNPNINHFVREVIQNVLDNKSNLFNSVKIGFHFFTLRNQELDLFLSNVNFEDLNEHLRAASTQPKGAGLRIALEDLRKRGSLLLLVIEDNNTTGLTGNETGDGSNFAALCKDELYSNKNSDTAGGSYGLGKAVLWSFSSLSTIIFNSELEEHPNGDKSPRLIGRAELPWHVIGDSHYSGSGWFGTIEEVPGGERSVSVWSPKSNEISESLQICRNGENLGTSILIIGFRNPAQEDKSPKELAGEIVDAVKLNYWPSIAQEKLKVIVTVKDSPSQEPSYEQQITKNDINSAFLDCWDTYANKRSDLVHELKNPGDVVEVPIELTIPPKIDKSEQEISASVSLLVRLAEQNENNINTVVLFRGSGMVVNSFHLDKLSLTQRPFHAIVVCGEARVPVSTGDNQLDRFLRAAEPPSHNEWTVTKTLKELYRPGYKKLLDELNRKVKEEIKVHVNEKIPPGSEGPQLLKALFPLQTLGTARPVQPNPFRVSRMFAELVKGRWVFSGIINVNPHYLKSKRKWSGLIDLRFCAEDGKDFSGGLINEISIDDNSESKGIEVSIKDGMAVIMADTTVERIGFSGSTNPDLYPVNPQHASVEIFNKFSWEKEN